LLSLGSNKLNKKPFYFSIDFEDFSFDLTRSIGLEPQSNFEALELAYEVINTFLSEHFINPHITFFTTGTVARIAPDLLRRIASDGHEIASHYNYHDLMFKQTNQEIETNLVAAKESIFKAVGYEPLGFRAPVFSIPKERQDIFTVLKKHFKYDSSYVVHPTHKEYKNYQNEFPIVDDNFLEIPVLTKDYFFNKLQMKSGGTFLRFFSKEMLKETMDSSLKNGYMPLIYLHPYDYLTNREFWVSWKLFKQTNDIKNWVKYFRQIQWIGIGNKSVFPKMKYLLQFYEHQGPMKNLLDK
jgi:hypothetical protein